ncbi:MAG: GTPase, partial [Phycisphaerae bacterium]
GTHGDGASAQAEARGSTASAQVGTHGDGASARVGTHGDGASAQVGTHGDGASAQAEACGSLLKGNRLRYGELVVNGEFIDEVIVSYIPADNVPTFDISAHGGVRVIERILEALQRLGAPLCDEGQSPALIWPTHNLIDQEAVETMSRAKTERAVRFLAWQHRHLTLSLESVAARCQEDPAQARDALEKMSAGYRAARTLIEGATVAILGPPNSGKSTLFNRLVGRDATIVSSRAGTTRDWVTAPVEMDGIPLTLADTAGHREATASLERLAIDSGLLIARRAELCLFVLDGSQPLSPATGELYRACESPPDRLTVINKLDMGCVWDATAAPDWPADREDAPLRVSARTGAGLDRLTRNILQILGYGDWVDETPCLFTLRQREIAKKALSDLSESPAKAETTIRGQLLGH